MSLFPTMTIIRTPNLMLSSPTLPLSNSSLKKSNSELVNALHHTLSNPDQEMTPLSDDRSEYEITMKLFFLPTAPMTDRGDYIRQSVTEVQRSLTLSQIDLLILSFPDIVLDADDTDLFSPSDLESLMDVYRVAASLVTEGVVRALGVAELSASKLRQLCETTEVPPQVNQINLKDCCVTPRDLILYAKQQKIRLFTHGDASDLLPPETVREVWHSDSQVQPLWVCKYTAVASNRGVVENKGYIVSIKSE